MLVKELAADRGWIRAQQEEIQGWVSAERQNMPLFNHSMDYATLLMGAALDYYRAQLESDGQRTEECVSAARLLAKDWIDLASGIDADERWLAYGELIRLFGGLLSYVSRLASDDSEVTAFRAYAHIVWGAFDRAIDVIREEPS